MGNARPPHALGSNKPTLRIPFVFFERAWPKLLRGRPGAAPSRYVDAHLVPLRHPEKAVRCGGSHAAWEAGVSGNAGEILNQPPTISPQIVIHAGPRRRRAPHRAQHASHIPGQHTCSGAQGASKRVGRQHSKGPYRIFCLRSKSYNSILFLLQLAWYKQVCPGRVQGHILVQTRKS